MQRTGTASLPLHGGKAPRWLFRRMTEMAGAIAEIVVEEYGTRELVERLADPYWFQSLSCAIGFDWHSSGTTTVSMGALKESLNNRDIGVRIAGGKGKASVKTPAEIRTIAEDMEYSEEAAREMIKRSRMTAKVDNAAVQDGYGLYHHTFVMDTEGNWAVVQQGLNDSTGYARRYHWLGRTVRRFSEEPNTGIVGIKEEKVLDMTAKKSREARKTSVDLIRDGPERLLREVGRLSPQKNLLNFADRRKGIPALRMPITVNWSAVKEAYEFQPDNYDELLGIRGICPSTVRALALVSELIHGDAASWKDPVRYSFAVGGKDGVPFPVDKRAMDESIRMLEEAIEHSRIGEKEGLKAIKRLKALNSGVRNRAFSDYNPAPSL